MTLHIHDFTSLCSYNLSGPQGSWIVHVFVYIKNRSAHALKGEGVSGMAYFITIVEQLH